MRPDAQNNLQWNRGRLQGLEGHCAAKYSQCQQIRRGMLIVCDLFYADIKGIDLHCKYSN